MSDVSAHLRAIFSEYNNLEKLSYSSFLMWMISICTTILREAYVMLERPMVERSDEEQNSFTQVIQVKLKQKFIHYNS